MPSGVTSYTQENTRNNENDKIKKKDNFYQIMDNKELHNKKNLIQIKGKPIYLHNLLESLETPEIIDTYITTDIEDAIENKDQWGYKVIQGFPEMHDGGTLRRLVHLSRNSAPIIGRRGSNTIERACRKPSE